MKSVVNIIFTVQDLSKHHTWKIIKQYNQKIKCSQVQSKTIKLQKRSLVSGPGRSSVEQRYSTTELCRGQNSRFILISKQIHRDNDRIPVNNSPGKQTHVSNTITWTQAAGNEHTQRSIKLTTFVSKAVLICNSIRTDVPQFKTRPYNFHVTVTVFHLFMKALHP